MTDAIKTYYPEVLQDTAFPTEEVASLSATENTYEPSVIEDQPFPSTVVANDLVNSSLNTQTRKILGSYSFTPTGALQIGKYLSGSSGDIHISPDGIVGRNSDGTYTFTLDGINGNATFKGNVLAGSLISGIITLGGLGNGDGILIVKDALGNIILRADKDGYHAYDTSAIEKVRLASQSGLDIYGSDGKTISFKETVNGTEYGVMGYSNLLAGIYIASNNGQGLTLYSNVEGNFLAQKKIYIGGLDDIKLSPGSGHILDVDAETAGFAGNVAIVGNLAVGGFKSSVVDTLDGKVLLYANESPESWFMDFCNSKDKINPIFLEVTVPPYKFIKCDDGTYQVWGKRKGFQEKTRRFEKIDKKMSYFSTYKTEDPKQLFKSRLDFANKMQKDIKK
jgi:hypothetical protein